jgi:mannose-1-phosphate guanylyltransferase
MSPKDEENNVTLKCQSLFYGAKNNIVALPNDRLAVIQDLDGYIVAESDNVLLICKLEDEQNIRQYVNDTTMKHGDTYI